MVMWHWDHYRQVTRRLRWLIYVCYRFVLELSVQVCQSSSQLVVANLLCIHRELSAAVCGPSRSGAPARPVVCQLEVVPKLVLVIIHFFSASTEPIQRKEP